MTIDEFDRRVPIHLVSTGRCPCGAPAQSAEDHNCGECAEHCTLEAYRRAEEARRLAEQVRDDEQLARIHAQRVQPFRRRPTAA